MHRHYKNTLLNKLAGGKYGKVKIIYTSNYSLFSAPGTFIWSG
jgi:hypothetical protein